MKNVLAFLGYRLLRRVVPLSIVTFLLGVFLAMIPGFLGCVNWWWLRWTVLLEPIWLIGDLIEFNTDPYAWVMHLFCCLLWLSTIAWIAQIVGVFRPHTGDFYDTKQRTPGPLEDAPLDTTTLPWARLIVPPALFVVLIVLLATDLPLRVSFALHRDALNRLAEERLTSAEPSGRLESTRWVGIYPVQLIGVSPKKEIGFSEAPVSVVEVSANGRIGEGAMFTETGYTSFMSHSVYGGFVYKGKVRQETDEQKAADRRLDDDWQVYRRGGGRGVFKQLP